MSDLRSALHELAREGSAPHAVDPEALWRGGRTRVWRKRGAGVVVAVVVALAALVSTSSIPEPHAAMPAGKSHAPAIPVNIYQPNRFLAGISETGPPGRLAVVARGDHGWFGISATTGRYTALDLPGLAADAPMALSPDGTRIAYGVTGPTRKKSFGPGDGINVGGPVPRLPMIGIAVYDVRTGDVRKQVRQTDYGFLVGPFDDQLSWLDQTRVEFGYYLAVGSNTSKPAGAFVWDLQRNTVRRLPGAQLQDARYVPTTDPSLFVRMRETNIVLTNDHGTPSGARIQIKGWEGFGPSSISVSRRFVVLTGPYGKGNPQRVSAAPRPSSRSFSTPLAPIGRLVAPTFIGWRSEASVLVVARKGVMYDGFLGLPDDDQPHLYEVALGTGKVDELGRVDRSVQETVQVARDLLGEPMVHGRKPPSILAALKVPLGIGGLVALVALSCLILTRRRRRG